LKLTGTSPGILEYPPGWRIIVREANSPQERTRERIVEALQILRTHPSIHMAAKKRKAPWKRAAPPKAEHKTLTPAARFAAKRSAKKAGRPYPNLVDNMRAAGKQK
jgi:hypothetical protein